MMRVQRENNTQAVNELKSQLPISKRYLDKDHETMKALVREKSLKESLEEILRSNKKLEENLSTDKDKLMDTSDNALRGGRRN